MLLFSVQIYATGEEQNDLPKMYANAHANPERPLEQYPWCHEPGQEAYRPLELWCATARHTCAQRGLSQLDRAPAASPQVLCRRAVRLRRRRRADAPDGLPAVSAAAAQAADAGRQPVGEPQPDECRIRFICVL